MLNVVWSVEIVPEAVPVKKKRRFGYVWARVLGEGRGKEPLTEGKVLDQRVGKREVALVPKPHRHRATGPHEAVIATAVVGLVTGVPGLRWHLRQLAGRVGMLGKDVAAVLIGIEVHRPAVLERQPVDPGPAGHAVRDHPEQVVERVVLHHQHHDVLDLGHRRRTGRKVRERQAVRTAESGGARGGERPRPGRKAAGGEQRGAPTSAGAYQRAAGERPFPRTVISSSQRHGSKNIWL